MKKNQGYSKLAKMARKLVGNHFRLFDPPSRKEKYAKKYFDTTPPPKKKCWSKMKKIKVTPNWLKWRENWSKIIFGFVLTPLPSTRKTFLVKNEQNQSYSKLAKMGRKLVGNNV